MILELVGDLIKLTSSDGAVQNWKPNEGLDPKRILLTLKDLNADGMGKALVGLKNLATIVNLPEKPDADTVDPEKNESLKNQVDQHAQNNGAKSIAGQSQQGAQPTGEVKVDKTVTEGKEGGKSGKLNENDNPGLNQGEIPANAEPKNDLIQAPNPDAEANKPAQVQILANDVEMTLEEFDTSREVQTKELDEADKNFEVEWKTTDRGLEVTINGTLYIYRPTFDALLPDWFLNRLEAIGKHSKGRAVAWLNQQVKAGELTCTKIKPTEEQPAKQWEEAIRKAMPGDAHCDVNSPDPKDWLLEFEFDQGIEATGSIQANVFDGSWFLQATGNDLNVNKKGEGLEALLAEIKGFTKDKKD